MMMNPCTLGYNESGASGVPENIITCNWKGIHGFSSVLVFPLKRKKEYLCTQKSIHTVDVSLNHFMLSFVHTHIHARVHTHADIYVHILILIYSMDRFFILKIHNNSGNKVFIVSKSWLDGTLNWSSIKMGVQGLRAIYGTGKLSSLSKRNGTILKSKYLPWRTYIWSCDRAEQKVRIHVASTPKFGMKACCCWKHIWMGSMVCSVVLLLICRKQLL